MATRVLIVDDEQLVCEALARQLKQANFEVQKAYSAHDALEVLAQAPIDVVLSDLAMPGVDGLGLMKRIADSRPGLPVIVMSGEATTSTAVEAVKLGAVDYLEKPVDAERLLITLRNSVRLSRLETQNQGLREALAATGPLVGASETMQRLRRLIRRVAPSDGRVLIVGENGTGKELVAAAVHDDSERRDGPFIKLNCAAVPRDLVESELFGHERGAFTGAVQAHRGKFELAHGGTLFLDEIGDMPMEMQVKLLRVLQEGQFERVGGTRTIAVDVRVIAATNRDPLRLLEDGAFREDLYYRLNVITICTPPLRERLEDIPELVAHFAAECARNRRVGEVQFTADAIAYLQSYAFPGNVRELRNLVERLAILAEEATVSRADLEEQLPAGARQAAAGLLYRHGVPYRDLLREAEGRILKEAIRAHNDNKSATARSLGLERSHFYKKLRTLGIRD